MEHENDIQARLQRMVEEEPNGREAKKLLRHLNVFQEAFSKPAVKAITPEDMSRVQLDAAFATLEQWGFIDRITRNRYQLTPAIRPHVPPTNDILSRHFAYFRMRIAKCSGLWSYIHWKDLALALLWGLERNLVSPHDFSEHPNYDERQWPIWEEWPHLFEAVRHMADALKISARLIASNPISRLSTIWHEVAFERYISIGNPYQQFDRLMRKARASYVMNKQTHARYYAERGYSIAFSLPILDVRIRALITLADIAIAQNDRDCVLSSLGQLHTNSRIHIDIVRNIAVRLHRFNEPELARHYFAEAAQLGEFGGHDRHYAQVLRDWSHFEYSQGNVQEALNLYRLSIMREMVVVDRWVDYGETESKNGWHEFEKRYNTWQTIEAAWNPL